MTTPAATHPLLSLSVLLTGASETAESVLTEP